MAKVNNETQTAEVRSSFVAATENTVNVPTPSPLSEKDTADNIIRTSVVPVTTDKPRLSAWKRFTGYFTRGGAALRHRNYRLFFTGQLISLVGTWMQNLAQGWLVLKLTNSVFDLGLVTSLQFLPVMFLSLFGGVLADRLPKRKTIIITQTCAMILALVLATLTMLDVVQVWHVYVLAILLGLVNAFDTPTRQAFVPEMVGKEDLMNAIALNSSVFNTARAIGPAVAGVLIGLIGIAPAFWVNGISYIAVITGLAMMRPEEFHLGAPRKQTGNIFKNLQEGLVYSGQTPLILAIVVLVGLMGTFGINFNVWIPDLAKNHLNVDADGYGVLMAGIGIGALVSALTLAVKGGRPKMQSVLKGGLCFAAFILGAALSPWFWLTFLLLIGVGVSMMIVTVSCNTMVQLSSPDHLRGRVMSLYMTVFAGTTPIGSLFIGWLASLGGTPFSMSIGALLCLSAVPLSWLVLKRKTSTQVSTN
ncbi:MAG TPA: MFS transporter [Chloroflexia bacterium]|nr:MFS transporter [Chloroflexia bacterium]